MTTPHRQLGLPFRHRPDYATADFLPAASNQAALAWLDRAADWPDQRLALWGEAGTGKTHLLHIWVRRTGARLYEGRSLVGVPSPPGPAGVAVDDADSPADEAALLHLLNTCRETGVPILLAAGRPPARWALRLPDLTSRLRAITAVEIRPPDDALLHDLLVRLLADRQLPVSPTLQDWLLVRLPRTPAALRDAVARLDEAQLAAGGGITRTLAVATLDLAAGDPPHLTGVETPRPSGVETPRPSGDDDVSETSGPRPRPAPLDNRDDPVSSIEHSP